MEVTKQDIEISKYGAYFFIPKGTAITHSTALGFDKNYNFIAKTSDVLFKWNEQDTEYTKLDPHSILYHDIEHYGLNIPADMVEEIKG